MKRRRFAALFFLALFFSRRTNNARQSRVAL